MSGNRRSRPPAGCPPTRFPKSMDLRPPQVKPGCDLYPRGMTAPISKGDVHRDWLAGAGLPCLACALRRDLRPVRVPLSVSTLRRMYVRQLDASYSGDMDTTRANVTLDSWILGHAKRVAKEQGKTLGEFTSDALKWLVAQHDAGKKSPAFDMERTERIAREEAEEAEFYADLDRKANRGAA